MVYLLHFDRPFQHVQHYVGYTEDTNFEQRIQRHKQGWSSSLMRAVNEAGIGFSVAKTWAGKGRDFERYLKGLKNAPQYCPHCGGTRVVREPIMVF